ncbi:MAG: hypothetical protein U0525_04945 [Patescibacteria group bacterium]
MKILFEYIKKIFTIYASQVLDRNFIKNDLDEILINGLPLRIGKNILVNGLDISSILSRNLSPLEDKVEDFSRIQSFIALSKTRKFHINLNHVGFCYKSDNIEHEKATLLSFAKANNLYLYHETSHGFDPWFFVGSKIDKTLPMIEFLPTTIIPEYWQSSVDMWLPQIQIDIDTTIKADELEPFIRSVFDNNLLMFRLFEVDNMPVVYRVRLGVLDGVNINLDIGSDLRDTNNYRTKTLKLIT